MRCFATLYLLSQGGAKGGKGVRWCLLFVLLPLSHSSQSAISAIWSVLLCAFILWIMVVGLDAKNIPWTTPCAGLDIFDLVTGADKRGGPPTHTESSLHANGDAVF